MRMSYEAFKKEILDRKEEYLTGSLKGSEVTIRSNEKLNSSYEALMVRAPGSEVAAAINLTSLFEKYRTGTFADAFHELQESVRQIANGPMPELSQVPEALMDYEAVKDKLFIRCSNAAKNSGILEHCPNLSTDDLAMTVHVGLDWEEGREPSLSVMVNDALVSRWGISNGTLFQDAVNNAAERLPVRFRTMAEVMSEMMGMPVPDSGPDLYVLGNSSGQYGASVIYYPQVLEQIHEKIGSFYMLPSSVHEWLCLPETAGPELAELEDMVRSINRTEVAPEEVLSDEVYHYNGSVMELARDYEKAKEPDRDYEAFMSEPDYAPEADVETEEKSMRM